MKDKFKHLKNNTFARYTLYGASVGASLGFWVILTSLDIISDPSGAVVYLFFIYFPSFVVSLPWSLITIFTKGTLLNASIISVGSILNCSIIGAAYGFLKKSD